MAKFTIALTGIIFNMKLNDILQPYKYFFLATPEDNSAILNFFNSISMDTKSFSLRYDRGQDFFLFSKEQAKDYFIFIMKDESGIIRGVASILLVPHFINGKKEYCAYLGDLRISPLLSAKIRVTWKKCYSEIIEHFSSIDEFMGIRYLYSAILDENQNAMRSLLKNNDQIIYHHLTPYKTFNIIRTSPFSIFTKDKYRIVTLDFKKIKNFLYQFAPIDGLAPFFSDDNDDELTRRLNSWTNLKGESFLAVINDQNEIAAIFAPWESPNKKLVIEKMSFSQKLLSFLFPLLGIPPFKEKEAINVLYLTNLTFNSNFPKSEIKNILSSILFYLLKKPRNFHVISFFVFPQWELNRMPFLIQKTKGNFYQVMSKKQFDNKDFIDLKNSPPNFEIGIA